MRRMLLAAAALPLLALAACGGHDGPSSVVSTANPEDPGFAIVSRTTNQGVTWFVAPVPAAGAAALGVDTPGAVQIGSASGEGGNTFRWTGRRSLALCANERTVQGPAQATVGGQTFTVAHTCAPPPMASAPGAGALSPFGTPMPAAPGSTGGAPGGAAPSVGAPMPPPPGYQVPPNMAQPMQPTQPARSGLPPRRPGLWRTTIMGPDGQPAGQQNVCLTPDRATNWTPDPEEARTCQQYQVTTDGTYVYGAAVCSSPQGPMRMAARFRGDYSSAYQGEMIIEVQGPQGPVSQRLQTESRYVGPCAANG